MFCLCNISLGLGVATSDSLFFIYHMLIGWFSVLGWRCKTDVSTHSSERCVKTPVDII